MPRAAGLLLGHAADRTWGDPRRGHPVALLGRVALALEQRVHADSRARGAAYAGVLVAGTALLPTATEAALRRAARTGTRPGTTPARSTLTHRPGAPPPVARAALTGTVTWVALGGTGLDAEAAAVAELLDGGDLHAARTRTTHLVGRDTSTLDEAGVVRAVIESLAENTVDAVVATAVWGALAGAPGVAGHRASNTLDAMVGHRTPRYRRFGWAAARLDDLLGLPAARLAAALTVAGARGVGGDPREARRAWREDAAAHPSPNAGVAEAAFAGALGVRLGGTTHYPGRTEERPVLGRGRDPVAADLHRARRLARRVQDRAVLLAALGALVGGWGSRRAH